MSEGTISLNDVYRVPFCPFCHSEKRMVYAGYSYGPVEKIQRYKCMNKACGRYTQKPDFVPMTVAEIKKRWPKL